VTDLHSSLNQSKNRRMQRREPACEIGISAIDSECVLNEVIRTDAEEGDLSD
jgi:hypothetical protein